MGHGGLNTMVGIQITMYVYNNNAVCNYTKQAQNCADSRLYLSDYNACSKLFLLRQQLNTVTRTQGTGFHLIKHLLNGFLVNLQQHNLLISPIS